MAKAKKPSALKAIVTKAAATVVVALRALGDGVLLDKLLKLDWKKIFDQLSTLLAGCAPVASPGKLRGLLRNPDRHSEKRAERVVRDEYLQHHSRRDWDKNKVAVMEFVKAQGNDKAVQDSLLAAAQAKVDSGDIGGED